MNIKILQRTPVLRIFNQYGQTYYVAKNGFKMPVNNQYTARVITANGKIAETLVDSAFTKSKTSIDLLKIANYCHNDLFWRAQIEQLYVDNFKDILLIPKVGNHTIVVGTAENIEKKNGKIKNVLLRRIKSNRLEPIQNYKLEIRKSNSSRKNKL
jgi:cell division protein FtsQ